RSESPVGEPVRYHDHGLIEPRCYCPCIAFGFVPGIVVAFQAANDRRDIGSAYPEFRLPLEAKARGNKDGASSAATRNRVGYIGSYSALSHADFVGDDNAIAWYARSDSSEACAL